MSAQLARLKSNGLVIIVMAVVIFSTASAGATASKLITGGQIKDHSITGKDIKLHSIAANNLKRGISSFGGPDSGTTKGATGPAGPAGAGGFWFASGIDGTTTSSDTYVPVDGMLLNLTTTSPHSNVKFTFEARCSTHHTAIARAEIVVDGAVLDPGDFFACQSHTADDEEFQISAERAADLTAGDHTAQVYLEDYQHSGVGVTLTHTYLSAESFTP